MRGHGGLSSGYMRPASVGNGSKARYSVAAVCSLRAIFYVQRDFILIPNRHRKPGVRFQPQVTELMTSHSHQRRTIYHRRVRTIGFPPDGHRIQRSCPLLIRNRRLRKYFNVPKMDE